MQTTIKEDVNKVDLVKNYILSQSYQKEFTLLMIEMLNKYGIQIFNLNGIGEQLDINTAIKKMANANSVANGSIDSNANAGVTTAVTIMHEIAKPHALIQSYYRLWKWLKKNRTLEIANEFVEAQITGKFYVNDMHYISYPAPYCYNHSCLTIASLGLIGIDDKNNTAPPKYLRSFFDTIEAYLLIAGAATAGATGISNLLVVASVFLKKMLNNGFIDSHVHLNSEEDCWQYFKEELTSFIYKLNQPARGNQSLFSNISIFDDKFLEIIIPETILFIDGEMYDTDLDTVKRVQEIYLDIMNEESERVVHTFPVTTACFSSKYNEETNKNEIQDKDFLEFICKKNEKSGFINIYSGDTATLSSCCFDGEQEVLTKSSNGVNLLPIKDIVNGSYEEYRRNFTVFHNGSWVPARTVKLKYNNPIYKITTYNNKELLVTDNHIHLTQKGDVQTIDLTTEDYIAFNTRPLDSFPEKDLKLSYEQGFLIGAYAGDGSKYKRKDSESYEVAFSLNENNCKDLPNFYKALEDWGIDKEIHINKSKFNVMFVKIYSKELYDIINNYVLGDYAYNKEFNMDILLQSLEFRKGIIDGWYATDGGNSNRIYTISDRLVKTGEAIFTSVGLNTVINTSDRTDEKCIFRGVEYSRNYPLHCIRWYTPKNKRSMGENFKVKNNTEYFKIKSIEKIDPKNEDVYCFEMHNTFEPYFTLPNGVMTHNCRLRSDKNSAFFNSFGGASDSIGSMGVVCINLPQLAYKFKDNYEGLKLELKHLVELAQEVNYAKRCMLKKAIKNGHLPLYSNGYMDLTKQFSTTGFVGLYNLVEILGEDITTENGLNIAKDILTVIEETNDEVSEKYKLPINLEGIPAENTASKLALKDKILGYNNEYELYSNQFIPLSKRCNLLDRIKLSSVLDQKCSGGSIMHVTTDSKIDTKTMKDLVLSIIESGVKYFAFNYEINQCKKCKKIFVGSIKTCPDCKSEDIEKYMRVVGFLTKKSSWSDVRQQEDRQYYNFN